MSVPSSFQFQHSRLPDPAEPRPFGYFNIVPYRESNIGRARFKAGDFGLHVLGGVMRREFGARLSQTRMSDEDNILRWGLPELSLEGVDRLVPTLDLLVCLDELMYTIDDEDVLESFFDDFMLSILAYWKLGDGFESMGKNGKVLFIVMERLIDSRPDLVDPFFKTLLGAVSSLIVKHKDGMTFEKFKKARADRAEAGTGFDLAMLFQGYSISDDERRSISRILRYGYLSMALSADYYGFKQQFCTLAMADKVDGIHNSVAFLMSYYGYDEDEAHAIVRSETLIAENKLLQAQKEWQSSSEPKSDNLRAYVELFMLAVGGRNYWQALAMGDHHQSNGSSKENRAQLIGKDRGRLLRLEGYAPPAVFGSRGSPSANEDDGAFPEAQEGQSLQSDEQDKLAGFNSNLTYDILAPFRKIETEENCISPYTYTKSLPGKGTLSKFIQCLRPWFQVSDQSVSVIKEVATMLFTASLMLDDIEDGSHLRRGVPAAHVKYGLGQTVNSTTYLFGKATGLVDRDLRPGCFKVMLNELENLTLGQGMDLNWTFDKKCPTVSEYLVMIDHKTGGFFRLVLQLMQVDADVESNETLTHLITLMGRYYQIRDDYQNLASEEYTAKKGFCDDLSEGKFSFPLIHLLQESSDREILHRLPIFGDDGQRAEVSEATKLYVLAEMKRVGSLEHTLDVLNRLFGSILTTLDTVEEQMGRNTKLRCLVLLLKL